MGSSLTEDRLLMVYRFCKNLAEEIHANANREKFRRWYTESGQLRFAMRISEDDYFIFCPLTLYHYLIKGSYLPIEQAFSIEYLSEREKFLISSVADDKHVLQAKEKLLRHLMEDMFSSVRESLDMPARW